VLTYHLSYADLQEMARNSLRYSFLDETTKTGLLKDLEARFVRFERSETAPAR